MRRICTSIIILLLAAPSAPAQFFSRCETGSIDELVENIDMHQEHVARLSTKWLHGYYHQADLRVLGEIEFISLPTVQAVLTRMAPTRAGVLFHAFSESKICSWFILPDAVIGYVSSMDSGKLSTLAQELRVAMGIESILQERSPRKRGVRPVHPDSSPGRPISAVLEELATLLIPGPIAHSIPAAELERLLVVPVGPVGTLPLAALPVGDVSLIDIAAVVVAPGFHAFSGPPTRRVPVFDEPVIAGNPNRRTDGDWIFPDLPGAEAEARGVASLLGAQALVGQDATIENVVDAIASAPGSGLIYLATHGLSNASDPLDKSVLVMADGLWPAREIQNLPLTGNPLVVLSACQTGLGKDFDVGTIGMTRAFMRAGASSVVMSLWNVDDEATAELMVRFLEEMHGTGIPAVDALRHAMVSARQKYPNPALWAGFSVFGFPRSGDETFNEESGRWERR
jgi:hypothetical protein